MKSIFDLTRRLVLAALIKNERMFGCFAFEFEDREQLNPLHKHDHEHDPSKVLQTPKGHCGAMALLDSCNVLFVNLSVFDSLQKF